MTKETARSTDTVIVDTPQIPICGIATFQISVDGATAVQIPYPGFVPASTPLIHHIPAPLYPTGVVANTHSHLVNPIVPIQHPANVQIVMPAPVPVEQQAMIGEDGFPLETPEVIAAKAAHAQAHAEAKAASEAADKNESEM